MNQSREQWKVGLFVFIGLVLLAGLLIEFSKGLTLFRRTYDVLLRCDTAGSLKPRAQVLMSGVQIGTVADIRLAPTGKFVTITLRIYNEYKIFKTAEFFIEQSGFLGDQYIAIVPKINSGPVFDNGGVANAEPPFNMLEVARSASGFVKRIDETALRLNDTLADVRQYLLNRETLTNLSVSAANLRLATDRAATLVANIDAFVSTNTTALAGAGTNLTLFSQQLIQFANELNGVLATNTPSINQAVQNVESSTAMLKSSMEQVEAGKGLAGVLLKNEQIGANLKEITQNLSVTSSNLNRLGLWGILWQHRPPKPATPPPRQLTSPKNPYD
jgi:phospholipid/cholesterol/gamma-HCH transport system substrate-binding protein